MALTRLSPSGTPLGIRAGSLGPSSTVDQFDGFVTHPLLAFFDGFSPVPSTPDSFSGFTTHAPLMFFDGFSGTGAVSPSRKWDYTRKRRR